MSFNQFVLPLIFRDFENLRRAAGFAVALTYCRASEFAHSI